MIAAAVVVCRFGGYNYDYARYAKCIDKFKGRSEAITKANIVHLALLLASSVVSVYSTRRL